MDDLRDVPYDPSSPAYQHHFSRSTRRALTKMALSLGIDIEKYSDPQQMWEQISEKVAGGIPRANATVIGDPFALFVTFRCYNHDRAVWTQTLVARSRTGGPIDEEEGKRIIAQFLGSDRAECEQCGAKLTEYSSQMTRMSVFHEQEADPKAKPMLTSRGVRETGPLKLK